MVDFKSEGSSATVGLMDAPEAAADLLKQREIGPHVDEHGAVTAEAHHEATKNLPETFHVMIALDAKGNRVKSIADQQAAMRLSAQPMSLDTASDPAAYKGEVGETSDSRIQVIGSQVTEASNAWVGDGVSDRNTREAARKWGRGAWARLYQRPPEKPKTPEEEAEELGDMVGKSTDEHAPKAEAETAAVDSAPENPAQIASGETQGDTGAVVISEGQAESTASATESESTEKVDTPIEASTEGSADQKPNEVQQGHVEVVAADEKPAEEPMSGERTVPDAAESEADKALREAVAAWSKPHFLGGQPPAGGEAAESVHSEVKVDEATSGPGAETPAPAEGETPRGAITSEMPLTPPSTEYASAKAAEPPPVPGADGSVSDGVPNQSESPVNLAPPTVDPSANPTATPVATTAEGTPGANGATAQGVDTTAANSFEANMGNSPATNANVPQAANANVVVEQRTEGRGLFGWVAGAAGDLKTLVMGDNTEEQKQQ